MKAGAWPGTEGGRPAAGWDGGRGGWPAGGDFPLHPADVAESLACVMRKSPSALGCVTVCVCVCVRVSVSVSSLCN